MYFAKSLSTFVVGALLATTALGDTLQVPRRAAVNVVAREEANVVRGMTAEERMRKRADECLGHIAKRRLAARTAHSVSIGQAAFGSGDDTVDTAGLATCFGVAIVGTWSEGTSGNFDRAMSHTYADSSVNPDVLEAFGELLGAVQTAKEQGLSINRAVMVAADPASYTIDEWTQEEIDMYTEEYAAYVAAITGITGVAPDEKKHHYEEVWKLSIKSDKTIECGPEGGDNKC